MNIVFRADANSAIGTGHVMRCLALAQAWQDEGGVAIFAAAELPDLLATRLGVEGLTVEPIAAKRGSAEDADALSKYAKDAGADWVVIDGYCFGKQYQAQVKSSGPRLLVIDDHGQKPGVVRGLYSRSERNGSASGVRGPSGIQSSAVGHPLRTAAPRVPAGIPAGHPVDREQVADNDGWQ